MSEYLVRYVTMADKQASRRVSALTRQEAIELVSDMAMCFRVIDALKVAS